MKWLAAATVAVIALLVLLWIEIRSPDAAPVRVVTHDAPAAASEPATQSPKAKIAAIAAKLEAENPQPGKIDPRSDAFFFEFDDVVVPNLTREAAKCYTGGLHRVEFNAKVKLGYDIQIAKGEVTVSNVHVVESTIDDPQLVSCFVAEVGKVHWHNDALPDWKQPGEDLLIRPERGMKKFTKENLEYEGDGPTQVVPNRVAPPSARDLASRDAPAAAEQ